MVVANLILDSLSMDFMKIDNKVKCFWRVLIDRKLFMMIPSNDFLPSNLCFLLHRKYVERIVINIFVF